MKESVCMDNISKINSTAFGNKTVIDKHFIQKSNHHFHRVSEYGRGRIEGRMLNQNKDISEIKEVIVKETKAYNFDFLKGLNETLNKDLAKKAYSLLK